MTTTNNVNTMNIGEQKNNYDDTGSFDSNNISQHRVCTSNYVHVSPHSYLLCIPQLHYSTTKMDVARAVENQILTSGKGLGANINNFEYVKSVTFVRAFDQGTFDTLRDSISFGSSSFGFGSGSKECYREPWYKIAIVNVEISPGYTENGVRFYTNGEDAFYNGVCRGDIVINSWTDAFFIAHPRTYFQPDQPAQKQKETKSKVCENETQDADAAFQKWKYEFKLRQLERKVKEYENTIRQNELDAIRTQNIVNEYAESIRFLTRGHSSDLHGLNCASVPITSFLSELNNRYARVCVSDTTFLEANRNMRLKEMNGYAINACDDCDACQELIHSIDHTRVEYRDELFDSIHKMICRINKSVQKFEKLHVKAERSLFGLRNRKVLEDFGMYLNTALEIMEEVTSRVSTFTQDLEYARCYGQLFQKQTCGYNYDYDYSEDADEVYENGDQYDNTGIESTQQMLKYFDENNQELYNKQRQQEEEQQQQQEPEPSLTSNLNTAGVYHEEAVIIEGEEDVVKSNTPSTVVTTEITAIADTTTNISTTTVAQETQQKKRGWLSWF